MMRLHTLRLLRLLWWADVLQGWVLFLLELTGGHDMADDIISVKELGWDTDLLDTLIDCARWQKICGLVAHSGWEVLFDQYEMRQGRNDPAFMLTSTMNSLKFLWDLYSFVADQAKRKELRALFRKILANPFMSEEPVSEIVALKQIVDEYDFLAKHNCHPPDGGNDA
jgi:hypothetical protein